MSEYQSARYSWRNVHLYVATTQDYIGGVHQAGWITYANLNDILQNILLLTDDFSIRQKASGTIITPSSNVVTLGDYEVVSQKNIKITDEKWFHQSPSYSSSYQDDSFRDTVRNRDGKCVVSGRGILARSGVWTSLEAAHVFPLELESTWNDLGYSNISNINSV